MTMLLCLMLGARSILNSVNHQCERRPPAFKSSRAHAEQCRRHHGLVTRQLSHLLNNSVDWRA
jgi:hypothetical protein